MLSIKTLLLLKCRKFSEPPTTVAERKAFIATPRHVAQLNWTRRYKRGSSVVA